MADTRIQDAAVATIVNLADRIPVSQGDNLPKVITVEQLLAMTPVIAGADFMSRCSVSPAGLPLWDGATWPGGGVIPVISDYMIVDYVAADYVA